MILNNLNNNKNILRLCTVVIFTVSIISCNDGAIEKLTAERDSLQVAYDNNEKDLNELNTLVSDIATSLDSIAVNEEMLYTDKDKDGVMLNKKQILENLETFGEILARQKQRIAQLEDSLKASEPSKWSIIISSIKKNLEEKEAEIVKLKEELVTKNKDIRILKHRIQEAESDFKAVKEENDIFHNVIQTQDEIINEGYVRIGTKKELQSAGLIKGGFLKKTKVNYDNVDKSVFNPVDIRMFNSVELKSDNPKILTAHPASGAYRLEKTDNGTTMLYIDNPTVFWSLSNFLIIQL